MQLVELKQLYNIVVYRYVCLCVPMFYMPDELQSYLLHDSVRRVRVSFISANASAVTQVTFVNCDWK